MFENSRGGRALKREPHAMPHIPHIGPPTCAYHFIKCFNGSTPLFLPPHYATPGNPSRRKLLSLSRPSMRRGVSDPFSSSNGSTDSKPNSFTHQKVRQRMPVPDFSAPDGTQESGRSEASQTDSQAGPHANSQTGSHTGSRAPAISLKSEPSSLLGTEPSDNNSLQVSVQT